MINTFLYFNKNAARQTVSLKHIIAMSHNVITISCLNICILVSVCSAVVYNLQTQTAAIGGLNLTKQKSAA